jgi:3-hydroxyisobutyrate dehydrogenase-like beta-hydroxyacid dehydrogenase
LTVTGSPKSASSNTWDGSETGSKRKAGPARAIIPSTEPRHEPGREDLDKIGLIGLGLVGEALSTRFSESGFSVLAYDIKPDRPRTADSAEAVAAACKRVVLSLPTSDVVASVVELMLPRLAEDSVLIDTTTGDPEHAADLGERLARRRIHYLDAEIGGSSRQVRAGDVIVLCGGDRAIYEQCADVLACFARRTFYLGAWGSGARMKLALNLVLGLNRAVLAEGLTFAEALGLDPRVALEVLRDGPAWSRVMDTKGAKMLGRDFTPEARLSQHLKDVRLILAAGGRAGALLPLSTLHREILEKAEAAGLGGLDNSAVIEAWRSHDE